MSVAQITWWSWVNQTLFVAREFVFICGWSGKALKGNGCVIQALSSFFNPSMLGCRVKWYCMNRMHMFSVAVVVFERLSKTIRLHMVNLIPLEDSMWWHLLLNWTSDFVMIFWAIVDLYCEKKHTPEHTLVVTTVFHLCLAFCCTCFHLFKQLKCLPSIFC